MYTHTDNPNLIIQPSQMPQSIPGPHGMVHGLSPDVHWPQYQAAGYRRYVPFAVPEGMVVIAGTRRVEIGEEIAVEVWDVETVADHEQRNAADRALAEAEAAQTWAEQLAFLRLTAIPYARALRRHFGERAESNPDVTMIAVVAYFAGLDAAGMTTDQKADYGMIASGFNLLKQADGTTWSLPWDAIWEGQE
jgi:hypothetical protein